MAPIIPDIDAASFYKPRIDATEAIAPVCSFPLSALCAPCGTLDNKGSKTRPGFGKRRQKVKATVQDTRSDGGGKR